MRPGGAGPAAARQRVDAAGRVAGGAPAAERLAGGGATAAGRVAAGGAAAGRVAGGDVAAVRRVAGGGAAVARAGGRVAARAVGRGAGRAAAGAGGASADAASDERPAVDRERFPYRMKDLCDRTGLPRQVVHFYIAQGLVPEGQKTGRNMAYYGDEHVERVRLVRRLQHERFLPLKAIRALLEERDEAFSPAQRQLLCEVRAHFGPDLGPGDGRPATVDAAGLLAALGLARDDLDGLVEIGLLAAAPGPDGAPLIAQSDAWLLELWADVRRAGFGPELGFSTRDLAIYEEAIAAMFAREAQLITGRVAHLPPAHVAAMVERALPLINAFLARYHLARARDFFAAL